jgi:hypothetical protein
MHTSPDYVVVGARGTSEDTTALVKDGAKVISERDLMDMILGSVSAYKENMAAGKKRAADEPIPGSSKPAKMSKTTPAEQTAAKYPYVTNFLYDGEIRLKGKTLEAYDCGGTVKKIQRTKGPEDMLEKFEKWLASCDGVRFYFFVPFKSSLSVARNTIH